MFGTGTVGPAGLAGQVGLEQVHWDQQGQDLQVGFDQGLQEQVLVDLPFLRTDKSIQFYLPFLK